MRPRALAVLALLALSLCACSTAASEKVKTPADQAVAPASAPASAAATEEFCSRVLQHLLEWRVALNLVDWRIGYACEPGPAFGDAAEGEVRVDVNEKVAQIWVNPRHADAEEVVLHELLHVLLEFVRAADSELVEEQADRQLTRLLLTLKRGQQNGAACTVGPK